jgi:uncharacterized membrane protein YqjE
MRDLQGTDDDEPAESTADLLREAIEEARELVRLEVALAQNEMAAELARAREAVLAFAVAASALTTALAVLLVAVALATGATIAVALGMAVALLLAAGVAGSTGYRKLPVALLRRTRARFGDDLRRLDEARSAHS